LHTVDGYVRQARELADLGVGGASHHLDRDPFSTLGSGDVREGVGAIPLHEVAHDAVVDRARMLLDPREESRRQRQQPDEDEHPEQRYDTGKPGNKGQRLEGATTANRSLALVAQFANPGVALLVLVPARIRLSGHLASCGRAILAG